ncbi:MAG: double-strand break repair protein AddB [Rhodobacteraceae bacterium]|nr:double-strand break repair protein AddB [Paracoccaceae bacterium]
MDLTDHPKTPRVYALPCGVDFAAELVAGLIARHENQPPEAIARTTLIVNTARMQRRVRMLFQDGSARFLPRILLLSDLHRQRGARHLPPPPPPLRRRLELTQLVTGLLDRRPDLAARASAFDLADSLARLMDEMRDEAVSANRIRDIDVSDLSAHWARAQAFFDIAERVTGPEKDSPGADLRSVVEALRTHWHSMPPQGPVILAGSTASRGSTLLLMQSIAELPQGAVVLPGVDFDQPRDVWDQMAQEPNEDHPQFRFSRILQTLGLTIDHLRPWTDAQPARSDRNRLVSLALRPAPVTDAWMRDGPSLQNLGHATVGLTLVQAASPREEAQAIALRLREAAETGQTAALITPDRMLSRQVTAALQRWDILPDDSAGTPLHLTAPGRFLRLVAALDRGRIDSGAVLAVLKHPLTHSGIGRGNHLILTRDLDLHLRKAGIPFPEPEMLRAWAGTRPQDGAAEWGDWVATWLLGGSDHGPEATLADRIANLRLKAEALAAGPGQRGSGELWQRKAGQEALRVVEDLTREAMSGGIMRQSDFADLLGALLSNGQVRDRDAPHPGIMIWGTLEARVGGADLVILGGLNEGSWPEAPPPDPWLNRPMRKEAGLLLPERQIGLSAHDFQQALAGSEVWLTRAVKSDDAETVASRWLNRLTNLLSGLTETGGAAALKDMVARGQIWLDRGAALDAVTRVDAAARPSPAPPASARPKRLSVTRIKTLIRDPYAIYASQILKLQPLPPLVREPDGLLRGIAVHSILEEMVKSAVTTAPEMMALADQILADTVPWPSTRALWSAKLARLADGFVRDEAARQALGRPVHFETRMKQDIAGLAFTLTGTADRIDLQPDGRLRLYDYKTGTLPSKAVQEAFDKQLLLEAAIAERGGIEGDPTPREVAAAIYLGVGAKLAQSQAPLDDHPPGRVWEELTELIRAYLDPAKGFSARRMMQKDSDRSDYDHLARFGEWDHTDPPQREELT